MAWIAKETGYTLHVRILEWGAYPSSKAQPAKVRQVLRNALFFGFVFYGKEEKNGNKLCNADQGFVTNGAFVPPARNDKNVGNLKHVDGDFYRF